jgi:FkbM family methyltransferase
MGHQWRQLFHAAKKTFLQDGVIDLLGTRYRVAYEARGSWVEYDYSLLAALAQGKKCILDVGANRGITSLVMASAMAPDGVLYAFEPSQEACETILRNALLNNFNDRIVPINALVSDTSGAVLKFFYDGVSVFASTSVDHFRRFAVGGRSLRKTTLSLDDFVANEGVYPTFVKIDVEGAEITVLRGMRTTLLSCRPLLFLEIHEPLGEHVAGILELSCQCRYRTVRVRTKAEITSVVDMADANGRTFVLLIPAESSVPEWFTEFDTTHL